MSALLPTVFTLLFYLAWAAVCALPAWLLASFLPPAWPRLRYVAAVAAFTLLVTPSFRSTTVALVCVPFAFVLLAAVVSLDPSGLAWVLREWPLWHAVAFPVTLLVALLVFRRLRTGVSSPASPRRGTS